ncbi:lipocalin family protein [Achromobacter sp.]|uniref:lipocalin family protein n=1 Tax=Achromobacter sp. TaxID=134375 RepID=UPI00289CC836|nr:lipocalin family protein [Achromobacter sp.]
MRHAEAGRRFTPPLRRVAPWLALGLLGLTLYGCAATTPPKDVTPVGSFDVHRYEGRWFEIARLDHRFERGMTDVTANYTLRDDGSVRVVNRGFDPAKGPRGDWRSAEGRARFTGDPSVASLKVSFFGPFYGGYHVAALDPDYRWALVVGPDRSYAWILARDKTLDPQTRDDILGRATALGLDTDAFIWVSQDREQPPLEPAS